MAPDRNISTVFAFEELDSAAMSIAEATTITARRRTVFSSAFRMMIGTRRRTMTSQATRERVNLPRKESDKRKMFGSRETLDCD